MPRLIKYNTIGLIDDIPDLSLAVIEHTALFYLIDKRFKGDNKYIYFAVAGSLYEYVIDGMKKRDANK
jgi:hypothetical protein